MKKSCRIFLRLPLLMTALVLMLAGQVTAQVFKTLCAFTGHVYVTAFDVGSSGLAVTHTFLTL